MSATLERSPSGFISFLFVLSCVVFLLIACGPPGSMPGFDVVRCILEPDKMSYDADGFELTYSCEGQPHKMGGGRYDLPEELGGITCEYVFHDFEIPILDPPAYIWPVEGSDPRCLEYVEGLASGLYALPDHGAGISEEPPEEPEALEGHSSPLEPGHDPKPEVPPEEEGKEDGEAGSEDPTEEEED